MALLSNINNLFSVDSTGEIKFNDKAGTAGYVLVSAGTGAPPVWTDRDTGGVRGTGTENKVVRWNVAPATGVPQTIGDGPITFSGSGASANSTFAGNITGVRGFFNSGATNVVATFTSTDGTATLQCADSSGNVEFGASGDNFVVQPAGGVAQLTVGASSSTFTGNILMGNTVTNPASGFADQTGIGLKYSTTVPELQVSSDSTAMQLGRTSTGGDGQIMALRYASNTIHSFNTNNVSIGTNATFAGIVTTDKIFVAKGQNVTHATSAIKISQENTTKSQIRFYGADTSTAGILEFTGSSSDGSVGGVRFTINADGSSTFTGNVGIGNPLAGETYPRELLDIRQSSGTDYPKILVKYDFNNTTTPTTAPTSSLLLSPGQFSSDDTAPRVVGYRTANFASAAARSAGLKFGVAQNNNAKDAVMITEASDIWQLNGANSTSAFAPWDVSYPDEGICINTPANGTKYLSFADSQTPSYGGGMRYFEASNFTELYTKLAGNYTTHVRLDRASPYTTWLNPESNGNVGIGLGSTNPLPLAKLHLEGTGDMIRVVKNVDSYGPQMDLILNQTSPSNGDIAAYINMGAKDNSGNSKYWGSIRAVVDNIFTEIGGFEFYTRAASDFSKRLKISAQGKVIVYQKDNVSGFYLDGANTRFYANGGGGTDYRGIECNSSGMWSWGETGLSNYFSKDMGIGVVPTTTGMAGNIRVLQIGERGVFSAYTNSGNVYMSCNVRVLSNGNNVAITSGVAGQYRIADDQHVWYSAVTANAGAVQSLVITAKIDNAGTFTAKGDVVAYGSPSDKRLKENIKPIESALEKVSKLQGVTFDWKESDSILDIKEDIGFIAQDVQKVIPELVRENEDGMLSMRHQGIAPILLEAIKELKAEIEELKSNKCNCNK